MLAAALLLPTLLTGGAAPPPNAVTLSEPRVEYRPNEASATTSPWIDANGWRILRDAGAKFLYTVKGAGAALATAEAFTYDANAFISTDTPGAAAFQGMAEFLKTIPAVALSPVADFGVIDDRSQATGELLNLLTRMNLLYRVGIKPDASMALNVRLGTKEYPAQEASNPGLLAHKIRSQLGDDHRSLRIYGSEVVVGRLTQGPRQMRVSLLNYAALNDSARPVLGLRVRVRGSFSKGELRASGQADPQLADWTQDGTATEFTIPELRVCAVVDLFRN